MTPIVIEAPDPDSTNPATTDVVVTDIDKDGASAPPSSDRLPPTGPARLLTWASLREWCTGTMDIITVNGGDRDGGAGEDVIYKFY